MASLAGDLSQVIARSWTIAPTNANANVAGTTYQPATTDGDIFTISGYVGCVTGLTSVTVIAECSADGTTWVPAVGVGGTTPQAVVTTANTAYSVGFYPANGALSANIRGNMILVGTTANVTGVIESQQRIGTSGGFQNTPPSGST